MTLRQKVNAALDYAPNVYAALFEIRLLVSPPAVQEKWRQVGYSFSDEVVR